MPYDDTEFSGRSDYQAFINNGIPSSGLFTGAEEVKTQEQAGIWGGDAGEAFDPCYHQRCDDIANIDSVALDVNADAIAFAVLTYAYSTAAVNGVPGASVPGKFTIPAPAGPEFTFVEDDGGAVARAWPRGDRQLTIGDQTDRARGERDRCSVAGAVRNAVVGVGAAGDVQR